MISSFQKQVGIRNAYSERIYKTCICTITRMFLLQEHFPTSLEFSIQAFDTIKAGSNETQAIASFIFRGMRTRAYRTNTLWKAMNVSFCIIHANTVCARINIKYFIIINILFWSFDHNLTWRWSRWQIMSPMSWLCWQMTWENTYFELFHFQDYKCSHSQNSSLTLLPPKFQKIRS